MPSPAAILIIRPSALGDVCRTVPVLASLRRAYPEARIDWLVQDSFVDAVWHHPALTAAVPFPRRELGRLLKAGRVGAVSVWVAKLRDAGYEMVFDCQGLARSGMLTWMTKAPERVGYADAREFGWLGLNRRVDAPATMHTVDRMLELVRAVGVEPVADMRLFTGPMERAWVTRQAGLWGGNAGYVVMAPTSRWPGKRWPAERFAAVAEAVLGMGVGAVAVVGGGDEPEQCRPLLDLAARNPRVVDLVGKTSVGQLMALIQGAHLVIANDSAALHMAVGFDRPSVGLFGPTRVDLVGPYQKHAHSADAVVIQHVEPGDTLDHKHEAAGRAIMERIGVDEVLRAADAAMGSTRTGS